MGFKIDNNGRIYLDDPKDPFAQLQTSSDSTPWAPGSSGGDNSYGIPQLQQANPWMAMLQAKSQSLPISRSPASTPDTPQAMPLSMRMPQGMAPTKEKVAFTGLMPEESYQLAMQRLGDNPILAGQKQGISDQEAFANKFDKGFEKKTDLSPLLAYFDGINGTKLAQSYAKPESEEDHAMKTQALQQGILKAKQGLTDDQIAILKNSMNDKMSLEMLKLQGKALGNNIDDKNLGHMQDNMVKSPGYVKAQAKFAQIKEARDSLAQAAVNPIAANLEPIKLALMSTGGQRLNIPEISAAGGSKAILDKLEQMSETAKKGTMSEANIKYASDLLDVLERSAGENLKDVQKVWAKQSSSRTHGRVSVPNAYQFLSGEEYPSQQGSAKAPSPNFTDEDAAAIDWAKKNAGDPRSREILQLHGM